MSNRKWLVRSTINLDDEANARYWATVFKVSDLDLVTAVMIVGSDAKDVAAFLGIAPSASSPTR